MHFSERIYATLSVDISPYLLDIIYYFISLVHSLVEKCFLYGENKHNGKCTPRLYRNTDIATFTVHTLAELIL